MIGSGKFYKAYVLVTGNPYVSKSTVRRDFVLLAGAKKYDDGCYYSTDEQIIHALNILVPNSAHLKGVKYVDQLCESYDNLIERPSAKDRNDIRAFEADDEDWS